MADENTIEQPEAAEAQRRADIRAVCRSAGLPDERADSFIDAGTDLAEVKAAAYDHVRAERVAPVIRSTAPQNDDPQTVVRRQSDAMAFRMGATAECPEDAQPYLGESLLDMARSSLARAGQSTRGMSADEIFARSASHTTSDFPLVVSNAMGKSAREAYMAAESTIKRVCRQRVLRDFKPVTSIRLSGVGQLEELDENGEITHTSRTESGESMQLSTYARQISVSRKLLINDDLGLLGDLTRAFGQAAAQTEATILMDLLSSNPLMADGTAMFDASRGNLEPLGFLDVGGGGITGLSDARQWMRTTRDEDGSIVGVSPRYLVVGPQIETEAEKILTEIQAAQTEHVNPLARSMQLLVEPRLEGDAYYVFADPSRRAALQYGYLAGAQGVQIQRMESFDTLGLKFRAVLDFGAGALDWRGAYAAGL